MLADESYSFFVNIFYEAEYLSGATLIGKIHALSPYKQEYREPNLYPALKVFLNHNLYFIFENVHYPGRQPELSNIAVITVSKSA